jgi:RNA-directed DNA polymerase
MLGIPTVLDRFIQQALLQVLSPICAPTFSDASVGFRPGRSTHQAVQRARSYIAAGHRWVADVKASFEDVDKWLRRKLRCLIWRQWKRPRTRYRELCRHGLDEARARLSAFNGRGPWWNAGASHMHAAVPTAALRQLGLLSLLDEHQRLGRAS